jgi:hypothetical protein
MNVYAHRRVCILCSSPMLGIGRSAAPNVCFICGLSDEVQKQSDTTEQAAVTLRAEKTPPRRRRRPDLRSV